MINPQTEKIKTPFAEWLNKLESRFPEDRRKAAIAECGTPAPNWSNKQRNAIVHWLQDNAKRAAPAEPEAKPQGAEIDGRLIAAAFINTLTGSADTVMRWRFLDDDKSRDGPAAGRIGTVANVWQDILDYQRRGYGIFYELNEATTDRECAADNEVTRIRAFAIDGDKGVNKPWHLAPSLITHTSKEIVDGKEIDKVHGIWVMAVSPPRDQFRPAQRRLAAFYDGDLKICNPSRVLRLPGTMHLKRKPQLVTFEEDFTAYTAAEILAGIPELPPPPPQSAASGDPVSVDFLRKLLSWIDPGTGRSEWFDILCGIRATRLVEADATTDLAEIAASWSKGELDHLGRYKDKAPRGYQNEEDVEYQFHSLKPQRKDGPTITHGTLVTRAELEGYTGGPYRGDSSARTFEGAVSTTVESAAQPERTIGDQSFPDLTDRGFPRPTPQNTRIAIVAAQITARYDVFHDRMLLGGYHIGNYAGEISDHACLVLRKLIRTAFNFEPTTSTMLDAAKQLCLENCFDPVCDYLAALEWDHTKRIDRWLVDYMGAPDTPFVRAVGRLALIAAVRRARKPGTKFDQIIVLEGPEGINKSTAIEIMAGKENFSDQSILGLDDRTQQERLAGKWLYEIADLTGISKADVEKVKAFASRTHDRARPAYAHTPIEQPRRCVMFATTNNDTYLQSQTGNRRFWSVRTSSIDIAKLKKDRDQLWAEAAHVEAAGASIMLPKELWAVAAVEQDKRLDVDPWSDALLDIAGKVVPRADGIGFEERVTANDLLLHHLRVPPDKASPVHFNRLKAVMRRLGWEGPIDMRVGQIRGRGYYRSTQRLPDAGDEDVGTIE